MFMYLANLQNPNQPNWKPVLPEMLLLMLSVLRIDFKRERESKCDTQKTRKRRGTKTAQEWENEKKN